MEYNLLGKTEMNISKITLGTWVMGGDVWWGSDHDDNRYADVVKKAVDSGINFIDTASGYGNGHSEVIVGKALKEITKDIFIATKSTGDTLLKDTAEKTVSESLKRLGRDYVDVYFIHWPIPGIDVRENMESLERLKAKGIIRHIGVSNFTLKHFELAEQAGVIDVFQPAYNLFFRNIEQELLPYCIKKQIGVMTYSSLCMGLLTGKYHKDWKFEDGDIRPDMVPVFQGDTFVHAIAAVDALKDIAEKYDAETAQCALNWVFSQNGVHTAIMGARTPAHLERNIKAVMLKIDQADLNEMAGICSGVADSVKEWDTMYHKDEPNFVIK